MTGSNWWKHWNPTWKSIYAHRNVRHGRLMVVKPIHSAAFWFFQFSNSFTANRIELGLWTVRQSLQIQIKSSYTRGKCTLRWASAQVRHMWWKVSKHMKLFDDKAKNSNIIFPNCLCRSFKILRALKEHIRVAHTDRRLNCPKCDEVFKYKSQLYLHLKRHEGPLPKHHLCDVCGKAFTQKRLVQVFELSEFYVKIQNLIGNMS